jgi:hypothetical protein
MFRHTFGAYPQGSKFAHATAATFSKTSVKKFDMFERKFASANISEFSTFSSLLREESCVVASGGFKRGQQAHFCSKEFA